MLSRANWQPFEVIKSLPLNHLGKKIKDPSQSRKRLYMNALFLLLPDMKGTASSSSAEPRGTH